MTVSTSLAVSRNRIRTGWIIALASTFCFSLAPTLASAGIKQGLDPLTLLMLRMTMTTGLLAATILVMDRNLFRIDRRGLGICFLGGISNAVGMITFFQSLTLVHSSIASMLFSISPLITLALLALRGEKFTYRQAIRVALGLLGIFLLIGPGGQVNLLGAFLASVSAFTVPFITVLMQWYLAKYDSRTITFYTVLMMASVVFAWWWIKGSEWHSLDLTGWSLVWTLAIATFLARIGMFAGIKRIGGGEMGMLAPLETFMTVIWSVSFLSERLSLQQWLGGGLILASAVLAIQRLGRVNWNKTNGKDLTTPRNTE